MYKRSKLTLLVTGSLTELGEWMNDGESGEVTVVLNRRVRRGDLRNHE